jgi:hypothetical protein
MNRLFALLREVAWTAVGSLLLIAGTIVLVLVGGELSAVVGLGASAVALAVINLRA